jgi:hypothetical protein
VLLHTFRTMETFQKNALTYATIIYQCHDRRMRCGFGKEDNSDILATRDCHIQLWAINKSCYCFLFRFSQYHHSCKQIFINDMYGSPKLLTDHAWRTFSIRSKKKGLKFMNDVSKSSYLCSEQRKIYRAGDSFIENLERSLNADLIRFEFIIT